MGYLSTGMAVLALALLTVVLHIEATRLDEDKYIRYIKADELRDYSGFCFDADRCRLRKKNETWTVDETCERATCTKTGKGTLMEKRTRCSMPPPLDSFNDLSCYIVRVQGRSFPDCCPKLWCNGKLVAFSEA